MADSGPDPKFLEPGVAAKFIEAIEAGASIRGACQYAGFSETAYARYRRHAENGLEPYAEFIAAVDRAEADLEQRLTGQWLGAVAFAANQGDHRPAMEFLARRFRKEWSPTFKQEVEAKVEYGYTDTSDVLRRLFGGPAEPGDGEGAGEVRGEPGEGLRP